MKGGGLEKYWTESEVYRCRGGNARLARKLAAAIGERRLRLGVAVREIRTEGANTVVRDAAGATYEADHVVLAVPPTTWHNIRFSPGLPRALKPQMGVAREISRGREAAILGEERTFAGRDHRRHGQHDVGRHR